MDNNRNWREQRREERRQRWEQRRRKWEDYEKYHEYGVTYRGGHGHVWTGIFILLVGVAALLKASLTDLPDWVFSWQTFLIALGVFIGLKHNFRGGAWFILMLVGAAFLIRDFYPDLPIRRYIWPGILIAVGAMLILKPRRRRYWHGMDDQKKNPGATGVVTEEVPPADDGSETPEDFVDATSVFGSAKKNIISKNFKGGDLVNIFGGTELDLTRADFKGTATIELTTIFGGAKLIVPSNWTIKSDAVTIFGGLEDKRNMQTIVNDPDKTLVLRGTVIFGGIEIKSF